MLISFSLGASLLAFQGLLSIPFAHRQVREARLPGPDALVLLLLKLLLSIRNKRIAVAAETRGYDRDSMANGRAKNQVI
jgi:hypothetical protein